MLKLPMETIKIFVKIVHATTHVPKMSKNILTYLKVMNVTKPYEYCGEYLGKRILKLVLMEKKEIWKRFNKWKYSSYIVFNTYAIFPKKNIWA